MANRLASATSPYLLQHAYNPVDWWEWGQEAFAEARRRGVPILLSVGYAACHWCHVMAHESFEDPATAAQMNDNFVCVKVDREERPDVDAVYMDATTAMTGHGGWPMTVFATPDGEPFYCGTYFPPTDRHGMPSFRRLLEAITRSWQERRGEVEAAAADVVRRLSARATPTEGHAPMNAQVLDEAVASLASAYDVKHGGFGGAPKFPPSMVAEFLLRHAARTGSADALAMVEGTCAAMASGGMYDQLGGGFARYSVDGTWTVPHFEKMLYDNALLLRVYAHLWRATGSDEARRVALETADWMLRDLRTSEGGFASAYDADSSDPVSGHPEEGAFYAWTPAELVEVLGAERGTLAARWFGVTDRGTFEHGRSVLARHEVPDDLQVHAEVRAALLAARERRPWPARDDKVVAAWNGLAVAGLADAGMLLDRPDLVDAASAAAELLVGLHLRDGRLRRTSRDGVVGPHAGVLEDYGDVAEGLLTLHQATGEPRWREVAGDLLDTVLEHFPDGAGGFFDTADDAERLVRRPQDPTDNATPSGAAAAAGALLTYAALTGSTRHRDAAEAALATITGVAARHARFVGWAAAVGEAMLAGPPEVAVVGPSGPKRDRLVRVARLATTPGTVVVAGQPDDPGQPLLADRPLVDGQAAAYVCRQFTCAAPTTEPAALAAALGVTQPW